MVAIADACGVSVEWLATGRGSRNADWISARSPGALPIGEQSDGTVVAAMSASSIPPGYLPVRRFDVAASAGSGAIGADYEQVVDYFAFREEFLRKNLGRRIEDLALIEARGDSMEPTIRAGDILTVDIRPGQTIEHGMLYVVRFGDNLLVKRIEIRRQSLILHSENPRYTPEPLTAEEAEQLHVIGHVLLVTAPPR